MYADFVDILYKERTITKQNIYFAFKRIFDVLVSLIGMVFLIPLIIMVKVLYILNGDFEPIMFKHKRIGRDDKIFYMYKFRTMVPNAEEKLKELLKNPEIKKEWKENHKLENDPRITKVGKFLRKSSLDEVPQVINILIGDMSLIGPRPMIGEEVDDYKENKSLLLSIRPGLTGWWACNGRSNISSEERKKLELYYVSNCNIKLDIKIIFMTIIKVIKRDGAK